MKFKEFFKELLKSLLKGRLHRILKFVLLFLFVVLSFSVVYNVTLFIFREKEGFHFEEKNFRWGINLKKGDIWVSFDYLYLGNPRFKLELSKPYLKLDFVSSLKEFIPVFDDVRLESGKLVMSNRKTKGEGKLSYIPRLKLRRFDLGEFEVISDRLSLHIYRSLFSGKKIFFGGANGRVLGKDLVIFPFSGELTGRDLRIPSVSFRVGDCTGEGNVVFRGFDFVSNFVFSCSAFRVSYLRLTVKKYGNRLKTEWEGRVLSKQLSGRGTVFVGKGIEIRNVKGSFDGALFKLGGTVKGGKIDVNGNFYGKAFSLEPLFFRSFSFRFSVKGDWRNPNVNLSGKAKEVQTPVVNLSNFRGELFFSGGRRFFLSFDSERLGGEISGNSTEYAGTLKLKGFELLDFKKVKVYKRKYGRWIPDLKLSGVLKFKKRRDFSFEGNLSIDRFFFRGFRGIGEISLSGKNKEAEFRGRIYGKDGLLTGKGKVDLGEFSINSLFQGKGLALGSFDFLRKLGLSGRVDAEGELRGNLKNPKGSFSFTSQEVSLFGVSFSPVAGALSVKDFSLNLSLFSKGVEIRELKVGLRHPVSLSLRGAVRDFPAEDGLRILKGYGVRLPFGLKGVISGSFSLKSDNVKDGKSYSFDLLVNSYAGLFRMGDVEAEGICSGLVSYVFGKEAVNLNGKLNSAKVGDLKIRGGDFSVSLLSEKLDVHLENSEIPVNGLKNRISADVVVGLRDRGISGRVKFFGLKNSDFLSGQVEVVSLFSGFLNNFTVKINGKVKLKTKYAEEPIEAKISGALLEPSNLGTVSVTGNQTDIKLILNGKDAQAVGTLKEIKLKFPNLSVKVNMAFLNVDLKRLSGTVAIPAFRVKPKGFYELYSVSGIYVSLVNGKPEVSDFTLSYIDGWLKFKDLKVSNLSRVSGKLEGELGTKGLVYLLKLNRMLVYARNSIQLKGEFSYSGSVDYRVSIDGSGVELRSKYTFGKILVRKLSAIFTNGTLERVIGAIDVGGGSAEIWGEKNRVNLLLSDISVGVLNEWKANISGKLTLSEKTLSGKLSLSKVKVFLGKKNKGSGTTIKVPINLNIRLLFEEPVRIKGELFWIELIPDLKVVSLNGEPVIEGTFIVTKGQIDYMGKAFKVLYGSGTIRNLSKGEGTVSILATAHISGYFIYMKIEGKLKNPVIYLSSDPPLTREQILNLIMTGAKPEEIEASSEIFPAVQVAYYATASLFKPFEETFRKALKLESFRIEPYITRYGETVAKLTVVKLLSKRVKLVGYGTTGQNPEYGGGIQLKVGKRYYLEVRYNSFYGPEAGIGLEVNKR